MFDVSREEITEGSLTRALMVLAAPLVAQNLVQVVQQVVDTFWLGQLGENAVAAVGLNFPIIALLFAVFLGVNTGTQVLVSQRVGSDDEHGARRAAFHGVTLGFSLGVAVAVLVALTAPAGLGLLGPDSDATHLAVLYLTAFAVGFPLVGMSDALEMGFVGWGDARAALYINVTAVVVNVALDPFLIFGWWVFPKLGIVGAALATVAGYGTGFVLALAMAVRGRGSYELTRESITVRANDFREIADVGVPNAGQHAARTTARVIIIAIVSMVGGAAGLAAYTVCARIASVAYIPAGGINRAAQSVIGQNLGADQPARAERATWVGVAIAVGGLSIVGAIQWFAPGAITNLFVPGMSEQGFKQTVLGLQIFAIGYWAIGAFYVFEAGFNGARKTQISMVASLLQYWGVRLPVVAVGALSLDLGLRAVFWAVTLSNVLGAVAIGFYYRYTTKRGMLERAAQTATTPAD